jgi:hypothetical protein
MSVYDNATAFRRAVLGARSSKSITTLGGSTKTLFNVTGGRVLVTSLVGRVTTAIGATTSNLKLVYNPTAAGTSFDMCTAVDIASDAVEQTYYITGSVASTGALLVGGAVGQANPVFEDGYLIQAGAIEANFSADPTGAGAIEWTITWISYDDGATAAAA